MMNKRLNQSGLAKELGLTRQRVSQLVKSGILKTDRNGRFDIEAARAAYHASVGTGATATDDPAAVSKLVEAKTRQTQARIELLENSVELQKQRIAERRGEFIKTIAAGIVTSQILEKVYRNLDSGFFRFLNHLPQKDHIIIDQLYRDSIRRAFTTALGDRHIAKHNSYLREKCDLTVSEIDAQIAICKRKKCDCSTLEACRQFAEEMQAILFDMSRPGIIAELTSYVPARIHPEAEPGNE
jgi:hypothetical protein